MKYDETLNMKDYIQNILEVVDQLRGLGKVIPDDDIIAILLCGVPENYDSLITSLEARSSEELSLEYVKIPVGMAYRRR